MIQKCQVSYDAAPDLGPLGQDDVRLAGHEDELQAPGRPRAHHIQHLLLREIQPHLQSARASDEAMQQPGELSLSVIILVKNFRSSVNILGVIRQFLLSMNDFFFIWPFFGKKVIRKPSNCEAWS